MNINLNNKKIIITGASKGLGSVCAQELSKEGAKLVLIARTEEKLKNVKASCLNSKEHLVISLDITKPKELKQGLYKAKEFLKDIDVVLHCAGGGLGLRDPLIKLSDMNKLFALNLGAIVEINRFVIPFMKEQKKGNLVHVGSVASREAVASVGYNTVKAGLNAYVRSLGKELAGDGIVVTGILPGGFYAPENSWSRLEANKPEIVKKFISDRLPRGFLGDAKEIIPMIKLLCSDYASMMGGCMVPIDAGEGRAY